MDRAGRRLPDVCLFVVLGMWVMAGMLFRGYAAATIC